MTGSLQRLLVEQKEKERLQNEISIAQEVQANLFPLHARSRRTWNCMASAVRHGPSAEIITTSSSSIRGPQGVPSQGDRRRHCDRRYQRKRISAALLMATLHSAVRAYRFAGEELVYSESPWQVWWPVAKRAEDCDELFQSPGRILSLFNRHLYRSTQPEKYATLFLAHYDADSAKLTYSNAGQLPPLVLGQDGAFAGWTRAELS